MALCSIALPNGTSIQPDTAEVFEHLREAETTEHPVEDGSAIADHIIVKPRRFTITTNWTPRPSDATYQPPATSDRPDRAFDILTTMLQYRASLTIELDGIIYTPVILTNVRMQRILADGDSRTIQLECKEIQIAQGQLVTAKIADAIKAKGKAKKKKVTPQSQGFPVQYYQKSWIDGYGPDGVPTPATVAVPRAQAAAIIKPVVEPVPPLAYVRIKEAF